MIDERELLEQAVRRFEPEPGLTERVYRRRDRKRRNQRISAGVVGIAVFVAAIWIVTGVSSLDRSDTSVVPGGDVTGPAETGPVEKGPAVTGPVIGNTGDPSSVGFGGLPPEGATQSEPQHGELVMSELGYMPWYMVNLYADGRLIWAREPRPGTQPGPVVSVWIEQRLTPEGVELLRSGAVPLGGQFHNPAQGLPVSAWEDPKLRPYVPSRYAVCPWYFWGNASRALGLLPARAQDLLRGTERNFTTDPEGDFECFDVTIEDALALAGILRDAGFRGPETEGFIVQYVDDQVIDGVIDFDAVFPDGRTQVTFGF
jgi:hypothetical protein